MTGFISTEAMDQTRETVLSLGERMREEGPPADLTPAEQAVVILTMTVDQLITKFQAHVEVPAGDDDGWQSTFDALDSTFEDARMVVGRPWVDEATDTEVVACGHDGCPKFIAKSVVGGLCLWHK